MLAIKVYIFILHQLRLKRWTFRYRLPSIIKRNRWLNRSTWYQKKFISTPKWPKSVSKQLKPIWESIVSSWLERHHLILSFRQFTKIVLKWLNCFQRKQVNRLKPTRRFWLDLLDESFVRSFCKRILA